MPKDVSRIERTPVDGRHKVALRDIAPYALYKRLKSERKAGSTHTLTTAELTQLVDAAAQHKYPEIDDHTAATTAAEAAKQRQNKLVEKRVEVLERLNVAQVPLSVPVVVQRKQPLDDIKRLDFNPLDRISILRVKLDGTLPRLRGFNDVGNQGFFDNANGDHVRSFQRGFSDLNRISENLTKAVGSIREQEWLAIIYGFNSIAGVKFSGIRPNFKYILGRLADIFDTYFSFISVPSSSQLQKK